MSLFTSLNVSASGLTAQRQRLEVAQSNLINATTTRTAAGGPYRRQDIVFQTTTFGGALQDAENRLQGVEVLGVVDDMTPFDMRYEPGHPDAIDGYVSYPNVDTSEEMLNAMSAVRSYDANVSVISLVKAMINRTLEIGK